MVEKDLGSTFVTGLIQSVTAANASLTMAMEGMTTDSLVKRNACVHVVSMHDHFILLAIHHNPVVSAKRQDILLCHRNYTWPQYAGKSCVASLDAAELSLPPPTDIVCQTEFPQAIPYPHE